MGRPSRTVASAACAALLAQSLGCGTIMYPERKGQKGGRIDAGVAVLDGVGLLFFILPGVIAFAVDFGNGTIYLPPGKGAGLAPERIRFDPRGEDAQARAELALRRRTGLDLRLGDPGLRRSAVESPEELPGLFASAGR